MPYVRHVDSEKAGHPGLLGLGQVKRTQDAVTIDGNQLYEVIGSNEAPDSIKAGNVASWYIPPSTSMTDLGESYLKITGYFAVNNIINPATPNNNTMTTTSMLAAAIFNDLVVEFNGTTVLPSQGLAQPYCHASNCFKNESYSDREGSSLSQGSIMDDPFQGNNFPALTTVGTNVGQTLRQKVYLEVADIAQSVNRQFSLTIRFYDMGLRTDGTWLPPNVGIRIRAQRSGDYFLCNGTQLGRDNTEPKFTFTDASAYISRKAIKEEAKQALMARWAMKPLTMPIEKVRSYTQNFPQTQATANVNGVLPGPTPKQVWVFPVKTTAFQGNSPSGLDPCMLLRPPDAAYWTNVSLRVGGGRLYPLRTLNTQQVAGYAGLKSTLDLAEVYQMYRTCAQGDPYLRSLDFTNIQPLCFQILTESTNGIDEAEDTSISFQGTLAGTVPHPWTLVMISFTDGVIEISDVGQVKLM